MLQRARALQTISVAISFLLLGAEFKPAKQYFYTGKVLCPNPGDIVELTYLAVEHIMSEVNVGRAVCTG